MTGKRPDIPRRRIQNLIPLLLQLLCGLSGQVNAQRAQRLCSRVHRRIHFTDRTDDRLSHRALIPCEMRYILHDSLIGFDGLAKIRIAVRSDIGISALSEAAHAAVSAALDADCVPEIIRI